VTSAANANIPAPIDAIHVEEWEPRSDGRMTREFHVGHCHIPCWDDDEYDTGETIVAIAGFQHDDGSAWRHIRLCVREEGEDEAVEVARFSEDEARKIGLRLLQAAEDIDDAEQHQ
jgi:hypothetical protein